ncbi:hypothetical protein [Streptomyces bluensis]|uniref:Uncharacterized protein n=1 Tax=Streptomyces bluensis TaxID=33897 RepID=A0ABW6UD50_9ACTN
MTPAQQLSAHGLIDDVAVTAFSHRAEPLIAAYFTTNRAPHRLAGGRTAHLRHPPPTSRW